MKEESKLLIGASLAMVISLGVVLAALLVLLAELYCSMLLRKRRLRGNTTTTTDATTTVATDTVSFQSERCPSIPYNSIYAHGVLQAPRSLLFPIIITKEEEALNMKKRVQQSKSQHFHEIRMEEPNSSEHCVGIMPASSPSSSYVPVFPQPTQEVTIEGRKSNGDGGDGAEHLIYISNPMYDNEVCSPTRLATPFETPDTSPSRLGISGSSSDDDDGNHEASSVSLSSPLSLPMTPPLTPMKKLPAQASSISLRDARSLGTSVSGSDSVNGPSSSSSGSPRTSPSW